MTTPLLCLLLFALWTLTLIIAGVGGYRVVAVLRGERPANGFPADQDHGGPGWYRRCNRAHLNCVENLPVFGAVVLVGAAAGVSTPLLATLAQVYLGARILQSLIHILSTSTWAVNLRFAFFSAQLVCVVAMAWEIWSAA